MRPSLRRKRDSNPRYLSVCRFSRPVQSTALPFLRDKSSNSYFYAKFFMKLFYIKIEID